MDDGLYHNLDSILLKGQVVFGFGWAFHREHVITELSLVLKFGDDKSVPINAAFGKSRSDVAAAFPEHRNSLSSGFVLYGGWQNSHSTPSEGVLIFRLANGSTLSRVVVIKSQDTSVQKPFSAQSWTYLLQRVWGYLRIGNYRGLFRTFQRHRGSWPSPNNDACDFVVRNLRDLKKKSAILVVDHDLGGGANTYRNQLLQKETSNGNVVVLFTFHVPTLQHALEIVGPNTRKRIALNDVDELLTLTREGWISEVFYNTGVSFIRPEGTPILLATLRQLGAKKLTISMHDYHPICPSHILLDANSKYCRIPSNEECERCLQAHTDGFVSLYGARDIKDWRKRWGACFAVADSILCFSNSSRELLVRAYPELNGDSRIVVRPHQLTNMPVRPISINQKKPLHIGIVGHISLHKGAAIVHELARESARRKQQIKLTVIGSLDGYQQQNNLQVTGAYEPKNLPAMIQSSGANVFLFPSICPETFSFVTEELIQLRVPLVCLDRGAPAERVAIYPLGKVVNYQGGKNLLNELINFQRKLAANASKKPRINIEAT